MSGTFSTVVVGDESLTIQCADLLRERGHAIHAIVTGSAEVRAWAEARSVRVLDASILRKDDTREARLAAAGLTRGAVDWLLSIANLRVLPEAFLAVGRAGAINFHDGPLPRYAGLHATTWALLAHERTHGVSWHLVEGGIDEGRVFVQREVPIADDETALTLNAKCYAAGIESFRDLEAALSAGSVTPRAQDLSQRTYFGRWDRPDAMCCLDLHGTSDDVVATVRALDLGRYPSTLGVAKIDDGQRTFLVRRAHVLEGRRGSVPGEVLAHDADALVVATRDGAVTLGGLLDADGLSLDRARWPEVGARLPHLSSDERARRSALHRELAQHESRWAAALAAPALVLPTLSPSSARGDEPVLTRSLSVPAVLEGDTLLAAVAIALLRAGGVSAARIGLEIALAPEDRALLAEVVPWSIAAQLDQPVRTVLSSLVESLRALASQRTFLRDLRARRPGVASGLDDVVLARGGEGPALHAALTVRVDARGTIRLVARPDRVSVPALERLGARLAAFLDAVAHDPSVPAARLAVLTSDERRTLLETWNGPARVTVSAPTWVEAFIVQVERTPSATALVDGALSFTYAELDARSNRLAHELLARGVVRGDVVGLGTERSAAMVLGMLAIQKCGAAYLPIDPDYPADRVSFVVSDSRCPLVVTDAASAARFTDVTTLRTDDPSLLTRPSSRPAVTVAPEDLAYVIYTSGSTGRPKGVMVEHRNVAAFYAAMDERIARTSSQPTWLAVTSMSFDISVLELAAIRSRAATVVVLYRGPASCRGRRSRGRHPRGRTRGVRPLLLGATTINQVAASTACCSKARASPTPTAFARRVDARAPLPRVRRPVPEPACLGRSGRSVTEPRDPRRLGGLAAAPPRPRRRGVGDGRQPLGWSRRHLGVRRRLAAQRLRAPPENYAPRVRSNVMFETSTSMRRLWRGEARCTFEFPHGARMADDAPVILPRPVQKELPDTGITIAGNPETSSPWPAASARTCSRTSSARADGRAQATRSASTASAWKEAGHPGEGYVVADAAHLRRPRRASAVKASWCARR
jgi:methionyl-tRNA formyltransferase